MKTFQNRVAVITGGASGIGLGLARAFASEGAKIVLADLDAAALDRAAGGLRQAGADILGVPTDVASRDDVFALADAAARAFGGTHVLCNNAGVGVFGSVETLTHADWQWSLSVNLWGVIHGVEAFLPGMIASGEEGHIVNTSSFAGLVPSLHLAAYNVAKAGVVALTESLRKDLRGKKIGASVLCPMRVATRIWDSSRDARPESLGGAEAFHARPPEETKAMTGAILDADHVAAMVLTAIRQKSLYVLPHHEMRPLLQRRHDKILAAFSD